MNEKMYELIDDYNLGKLTPPEIEKFEAAMKSDAELNRTVADKRLEWEAHELLAEKILRAQILQQFQEIPPEPAGFLAKNWKWALPAILLLGLAGFLFFQKKGEKRPENQPPTEVLPQNPPKPNLPIAQTPTVEKEVLPKTNAPKPNAPKPEKQPALRQIAIAAYRVPEGISGIRGVGNADTIQLAGKAFSEKNYQQVVELLRVLPEDERQPALSLRAHAYFLSGKYAEAAADFAQLESGGMFRRDAQWFGLLSKMSVAGADKNALKNDLDAIRQNPKHRFQKDAEALWAQVFGE